MRVHPLSSAPVCIRVAGAESFTPAVLLFVCEFCQDEQISDDALLQHKRKVIHLGFSSFLLTLTFLVITVKQPLKLKVFSFQSFVRI